MRQILYGRATTTHVVRAFPRRSSALKAASARQFGVNFSKIVRWRERGQVCLWQVCEQVWNHAKASSANTLSETNTTYKKYLSAILHSLPKRPALMKSFFKMKDIQHILRVLA